MQSSPANQSVLIILLADLLSLHWQLYLSLPPVLVGCRVTNKSQGALLHINMMLLVCKGASHILFHRLVDVSWKKPHFQFSRLPSAQVVVQRESVPILLASVRLWLYNFSYPPTQIENGHWILRPLYSSSPSPAYDVSGDTSHKLYSELVYAQYTVQ